MLVEVVHTPPYRSLTEGAPHSRAPGTPLVRRCSTSGSNRHTNRLSGAPSASSIEVRSAHHQGLPPPLSKSGTARATLLPAAIGHRHPRAQLCGAGLTGLHERDCFDFAAQLSDPDRFRQQRVQPVDLPNSAVRPQGCPCLSIGWPTVPPSSGFLTLMSATVLRFLPVPNRLVSRPYQSAFSPASSTRFGRIAGVHSHVVASRYLQYSSSPRISQIPSTRGMLCVVMNTCTFDFLANTRRYFSICGSAL